MRIIRSVRMMRRAMILSVFALLLAVPAHGSAQVLTPPGKAGANQYFETVPSSGGNAAPPGFTGSNSSGTNAIAHFGHGRVGVARLSHLGKTGAAAAALAAATAPTSAGAGSSAGGSPPQGAGTSGSLRRFARSYAISQPPGRSGSSALAGALTGSDLGGLGILFPLLLGGALLVAVVLAVQRTRRHRGPPDLTA